MNMATHLLKLVVRRVLTKNRLRVLVPVEKSSALNLSSQYTAKTINGNAFCGVV